MTDQEIENKIYEIISYESGIPIDSLNHDINFENDLDDTVLVELVMAIEDAGIVETEFDDNDVMDKAKTIGEFIDLVKSMRRTEGRSKN
jgi:acyl carrier protein